MTSSMKYVVTAPGRSGTTYAATVLSKAGAQCGHENVFNSWGRDFGVAPQWRTERYWWGDSSYICAPFLNQLGLKVVHLIRPPLDMIRSVVGIAHVGDISNPWVQFLNYHARITQFPPGPERAASYWVRWNRMIEQANPDLTWRLTEITSDDILELGMVADIDIDPSLAEMAVADTPTDINHRQRAEWVTLDHLGRLRNEVVEAAERYGVPLETPAVEGYEPDVFIADEIHDWAEAAPELVLNHTGAGWYELVDSLGDVVEKVRGKAEAEARRDELSRGTTESIAEGGA